MAIKATDGREIFPLVFGTLPSEGPRIGVLGDSGCGKTEAMKVLIAEYLRRMPNGIALVIDDKEATAQFKGQEREDKAHLQRQPATREPRIVVFRGRRFDRKAGRVNQESIAEMQWTLCQAKPQRPSLVVYDELANACSFGQFSAGDESTIEWAFRQGRSSGATTIWGTQETQSVPAAAFNQSSYLLVFRMVGNPLRLLKERGYLEGEGVARVIAQLPGDELPREQRGYFVLLRRGRPWDGKVYRFAANRV